MGDLGSSSRGGVGDLGSRSGSSDGGGVGEPDSVGSARLFLREAFAFRAGLGLRSPEVPAPSAFAASMAARLAARLARSVVRQRMACATFFLAGVLPVGF